MSIAAVTAIASVADSLIERVWPDPEKQAEAKLKVAELAQKGDLAELNAYVQIVTAQLKVNEAEARTGSKFIAGWRPFIGWVCGFGIAGDIFLFSIIEAFWDAFERPVTAPLYGIAMGMLGLRTWDKWKGTDTQAIK